MGHQDLRTVTAGLAMLPIVLWFFAPSLAQQVSQNQKATVEVKAAPERMLPGEKVAINGTTDVDAKTSALTIAVTNTLSHNTVTISATANSEGAFSAVYETTQTPGNYEVVTNSPSGRVWKDFPHVVSLQPSWVILAARCRTMSQSRESCFENRLKSARSDTTGIVDERLSSITSPWPAVIHAHVMETRYLRTQRR